ncbi:MAG: AMP-binding protein, partial [bacterium]|nr:AMP-binding protein [bacterium]
MAREETSDNRRPLPTRLVAYLVAAGETAPAARALRAFLRETLPDYMVPSDFAVLDALPRTPAGKVDRAALARRSLVAVEWARGIAEEGVVAPGDPSEELLAGIWAEVLGVERVGAHESFFELGGHSLLATQVAARVRETFGVELSLQGLFEAPTVAKLAEAVTSLRREERGQSIPPLVPVARDRELPLSFAQQRLWFLDQFEPASPVYNIPSAVRFPGTVPAGLLERIFNEVVRRHEALRTTFAAEAGRPHQVIAEELDLPLPVVDLRRLAAAEREAVARRLAEAEALRPFDLSRGPLVRSTLLRVAPDDQRVLVTIHHIVSDGWSMEVLRREVGALLAASFEDEAASALPELPVQYADFAHWQRQWLAGEVLEVDLPYWREQLAGAPPCLVLPTDRPRPAMQTFRGRHLGVGVPPEVDKWGGSPGGGQMQGSPQLSEALAALSRQQGATLFMTLLAAFKILLSHWTGETDVVVGSPIAGRTHKELEGLIGFFVNTLVLRNDLSGSPAFDDLLARIRRGALDAYAHQDVPFERLVEELDPDRNMSFTPLFQVMFTLQNTPQTSPQGQGQGPDTDSLATESGTAKFDLALSLRDSAAGLHGVLEYNTDLFDRTTMERLWAHFELLLAAIVDAPGERIGELPRLTAAERHQLLAEWNDTAAGEKPAAGLIHELFERQAARTPEAVALVFADQRLTYRELDRRANQLAHHLRSLGIGGPAYRPEARVGICAERSVELVVALLGILKSGGAYVALDPGYPPDRLAFMQEDAGVRVLLTQERVRDALNPSPRPSPLGGGSRK